MRSLAIVFLATAAILSLLSDALAEDAPSNTHEQLDIQGWTIWLNRSLRKNSPRETELALNLINGQLKRVVDVIPAKAVVELRKVPVWVNPQYPGERPRCEYHPGAGWLSRNGRDPRMEKAIEVSNVANFKVEDRRMPYLMLHELAHSYHDLVLGFEHPEIEAAFQAARLSGGYEQVQRFNGRKMVTDRAYALSNAKEYFAENTEAFFGRNDFYPFDRSELQEHDPRLIGILQNVWQVDSSEKPFVEYEPATQNYLKRIQAGRNEFGYRQDWPGGFRAWQADARDALVSRIGLERIESDLKGFVATSEFEAPVQVGNYQRIRGEMQTEPDVKVPFYVLIPEGDGPFPLAICPHGHSGVGWHSYAGVFEDDQTRQDTLARNGNIAEQLVKRGFVAIAPATRGLAKETFVPDVKNRHGKRNCRAQFMHCILSGRTPIAERLWDLRKITDWALQHPGVDPSRVVMLGNSGGGVATAYAAAIDTRITAAIPSCSFTSITSREGFIFHCDCCAIPGILDWGDLSDVGGLIAPRPLLILHGPQDSLHNRSDVEQNATRVAHIYSAARATPHLQQSWGDAGHQFYPELMWKFLNKYMN